MDLYSEVILDHYRSPHHHKVLKKPTIRVTEHNPLCGDTIQLDLQVNEGVVNDVGFFGVGCAISQASASMLMDHIIGKKLNSLKKISSKDIFSMLEVAISPARTKCALLSLAALQTALKETAPLPNKKSKK